MTFFYYLALAVGIMRFPFAHQLAENNGRCGKQVVSCSGLCGKEMAVAGVLKCSCDESCLYIGDCCFDFLYLCKGGNDLDAALTRQGQIMSSFRNETLCIAQYVQSGMTPDHLVYKLVHIPMIAKCPSNAAKRVRVLCEDYDRHAFPALPEIPVNYHGRIYRNIYCSLCSGANPEEVSLLRHTLFNATDGHDSLSQQLSPLIIGFDVNQYNRFIFACDSIHKMKDLQCTMEEAAEECMAYQAPIKAGVPYDSRIIFMNLACAKCVNASIGTEMCILPNSQFAPQGIVRKWISLFDFVGKSYYTSSQNEAAECNSIRCQDGYMLLETSCTHCIKKNTSNSSISMTWFQPTILLMFQSHDAANTARNMYGGHLRHIDPSCNKTTRWLQNIGLNTVNAHHQAYQYECHIFPISLLEVQFYINILRSDILMEQLLPGLQSKLHSAVVFNFDANDEAHCKQGIIATILLDDITQGNASELDNKLQNGSYHRVPWAFARSFVISEDDGRVLKLLCVDDHEEDLNCFSVDQSNFDSCPKVEIEFITESEYGFETKNGHLIHHAEHILTSGQTALICANQCNIVSFFDTKTLDILVPICYSVSMSCLMITFLIYLVTPPLRNVPGLMLMNLIMALFLAQMTYLISSYRIFINHQHWCQFLGAIQHYFWLTAFAWMACITVDIYQCLSSIHVSHPDSHKQRYYKLVASCWLVPLIFPLITIFLQLSGSASVGYGGHHTCWFINPRSVLYFFAIPVLTIVLSNITMFLGCVYRIRQISNNACYVGRKEDGKLRLIQCVKISSWIGTSWLFGILPNVVNRSELWYMFTICNALQGVQIFLAFGISKRTRSFLCGKINDHVDEPTMSTTGHAGF